MRRQSVKVIKEITLISIAVLSVFSFLFGLGNGSYGCKYKSIGEYFPPYAIGCELTNPRFEKKCGFATVMQNDGTFVNKYVCEE